MEDNIEIIEDGDYKVTIDYENMTTTFELCDSQISVTQGAAMFPILPQYIINNKKTNDKRQESNQLGSTTSSMVQL